MSRKHYVAVAAILAEQRADAADDATRKMLDRIAADLAAEFKRDNGRFDRARFLDAAGVGS